MKSTSGPVFGSGPVCPGKFGPGRSSKSGSRGHREEEVEVLQEACHAQHRTLQMGGRGRRMEADGLSGQVAILAEVRHEESHLSVVGE